ncbi:MAG: hypothetical protein ACRC1H_18320 [Caldilineaceae bacterium]
MRMHESPSHGVALHSRLAASGIGYAGLDGAWWMPAAAPVVLPHPLAGRLDEAAAAVFALLDCVAARLAEDADLVALLSHKVPAALQPYASPAPVLAVRPDFQLIADPSDPALDSSLASVVDVAATELEICPSAHGFAHAMQEAAGLPTDLADAFASFLAGRTLLFVGSAEWSEFLIEQLAFCKALAKRGAHALVLYDRTLAQLDAEVRAGARWVPPIFGIDAAPPGWQQSLLARLEQRGLRDFWLDEPPHHIGANTVLFRFGYLDCFAPDARDRLVKWEADGAEPLNPCHFVWENKAVMAALALPALRSALESSHVGALAVLDKVIPETLLLTPEVFARLVAEQAQWVLKFAGFDGGNRAWGGRSLQVGPSLAPAAWQRALIDAMALSFPVVAQRLAPSAATTVAHVGNGATAPGTITGPTRLRSFFLRAEPGAKPQVLGSHATVVAATQAGTMRVSEALDSVQAPVVFVGGGYAETSVSAQP